MRSDDPQAASEVIDVLWDRLGPDAEAPSTALGRLEALRVLRARRASRAAAPKDLDPDVAAMFGLLAKDSSDLRPLLPEIAALLSDSDRFGFPREALPTVFQAYVRGVARIVAAEASIAREALAHAPADMHAGVLDVMLRSLLPAASRGFEILHRMMLLDALVDALAGLDDADNDEGTLAIAMVDLVGSTRHLSDAQPAELERMIDALFEAGQSATGHRSAYVLKYVGDGLFLAGRDTLDVADAALDVIVRLENALPLRARGGLAFGHVVQRAGDLFGLPINIAHVATKAAKPGTLIATAAAATHLPVARRSRYRMVHAMHPVLNETQIATVRPA